MNLLTRSGWSCLAFVALAACAAPSPPADGARESAKGTGSPPASSVSDTTSDAARVAKLEAEARALASATGCATAGACRTAPVGEKACGGPRTFLTYCPATTDSVALFRKLDELRTAETDANKRNGAISTCELRLPPTPTLVGGRCTVPP